jgi:hypothetical protein
MNGIPTLVRRESIRVEMSNPDWLQKLPPIEPEPHPEPKPDPEPEPGSDPDLIPGIDPQPEPMPM